MVGITKDRTEHIIWVARRCADIAKERGYNEDIQKQAFLMGWNHDIGYEYTIDPEAHAGEGAQMIRESLGKKQEIDYPGSVNLLRHLSFCWWPEIQVHGFPKSHPKRMIDGKPYESEMLDILNIADITTMHTGRYCTPQERLDNLVKRGYGPETEKNQNMLELCKELKLL